MVKNSKQKLKPPEAAAETPVGPNDDEDDTAFANPYTIALPLGFLLGSFLLVVAVAFGVGRACRIHLLPDFDVADGDPVARGVPTIVSSETLPVPILDKCKCLPNFTYTGKHYGTGLSKTSDNLLVRLPNDGTPSSRCGCKKEGGSENDKEGGAQQDDNQIYQPAGQHLLVDIKNVDGIFLNSEQKLALAMVELIKLSELTMLSYHCHKLAPVGVSCVGVLLESHVSFHTWPIEGVITFDLFTCGESSLLPLLPVIERLFGVQRPAAVTGGTVEKAHVQWSYKLRGFRREEASNPVEAVDLHQFLLGWMEYDMKEKVVEVQTEYQKVEIYEVISPRLRGLDSYKRSLSNDDSYESQHPKLFQPDKVVFLDGVVQSRRFGEAAYHEALVHPAMLAHDNPKRVAIIGGGEGATLREVLKHKTVETVTMVEIDEIMVETSRKYLPEWSDCSNLVGSATSCFDDPRTETFYTDAIKWFIDRYVNGEGFEAYDVIIMDALDPSAAVEFSDVLYDNEMFAKALFAGLGPDGIFVAQVGQQSHKNVAPPEFTDSVYEMQFRGLLDESGFSSAKEYFEAHGGFLEVWRFIIAFKRSENMVNWYADQATIDLKLKRVAMETSDGSETPFRYFDGATLMTYQFGSRISENFFCQSIPTPAKCDLGHGLDPEIYDIPASSLEVRQSLLPNGGRGLFYKESAPKGSYIASELMVGTILLLPFTTYFIEEMLEHTGHEYFKLLDVYMFGYGYSHDFYGLPTYSVEPSILTFTNHGCDGTYNTGEKLSVTELTADPKQMPFAFYSNVVETSFFNPFIDRNHLLFVQAYEVTLRDVQSGEEVLDNYLGYLHEDNWESGLADYRAQCANQSLGAINRYEKVHSSEDKETQSVGDKDEL